MSLMPSDFTRSDSVHALQTMITRYRTTQMISVVAKLGIADLLKDGPKVSTNCHGNQHACRKPLPLITGGRESLVIFAEDDQRHFALTTLAEPLARTPRKTLGSKKEVKVNSN